MTPSERRLCARTAAFAMHAQGKTNAAPAFAARMRRLEDRVDPDRVLAPEERAKRVQQALRADMSALSLRALRAKNKKAVTVTETPVTAEPEVHSHARPAA